MPKHKVRRFKAHEQLCLEDLVPPQHFYRQLEARLDLSFVRGFVKDQHLRGGRPSIDPVVFFELQRIMFLEGIHSERRPMDSSV